MLIETRLKIVILIRGSNKKRAAENIQWQLTWGLKALVTRTLILCLCILLLLAGISFSY